MTDQRPHIPLDTLNLNDAHRRLCTATLERANSPAGAAPLLGVSPDEVHNLMTQLQVQWPPTPTPLTGGAECA